MHVYYTDINYDTVLGRIVVFIHCLFKTNIFKFIIFLITISLSVQNNNL